MRNCMELGHFSQHRLKLLQGQICSERRTNRRRHLTTDCSYCPGPKGFQIPLISDFQSK